MNNSCNPSNKSDNTTTTATRNYTCFNTCLLLSLSWRYQSIQTVYSIHNIPNLLRCILYPFATTSRPSSVHLNTRYVHAVLRMYSWQCIMHILFFTLSVVVFLPEIHWNVSYNTKIDSYIGSWVYELIIYRARWWTKIGNCSNCEKIKTYNRDYYTIPKKKI